MIGKPVYQIGGRLRLVADVRGRVDSCILGIRNIDAADEFVVHLTGGNVMTDAWKTGSAPRGEYTGGGRF